MEEVSIDYIAIEVYRRYDSPKFITIVLYLNMHSGISLNWFSESHSEISERFPNSSGNVFNSLLLFYHLRIILVNF